MTKPQAVKGFIENAARQAVAHKDNEILKLLPQGAKIQNMYSYSYPNGSMELFYNHDKLLTLYPTEIKQERTETGWKIAFTTPIQRHD